LQLQFLIGHLGSFKKNPVAFLSEAALGGEIVPLYLPKLVYLLNSERAIRHVLVDNHANYRKGTVSRRLKVFLGEGLLTTEGNYWKYQRRLIQPVFVGARLDDLLGIICKTVHDFLPRLEQQGLNGGIEITSELTRLTTSIIGKIVLGVDLMREADHIGQTIAEGLELAQKREFSLLSLPLWVPTATNRQSVRIRNAVSALILREIESHKHSSDSKNDILSHLMDARDEDGRAMTVEQLRDQSMTLLLAGHVTTATSLSWLFYLLGKHQEHQEYIAEEVASVLGDAMPGLAEIDKLKYTRACVEEGLRLYPPSWLLHREAINADIVSGVKLVPGMNVLISPYLIHRHPHYWDNVEGFEPNRFLTRMDDHKFAYIPFGAGPRHCVGAKLADVEAVTIVASIIRKYRITLMDRDVPLIPKASVTLRPSRPIHVSIHKR